MASTSAMAMSAALASASSSSPKNLAEPLSSRHFSADNVTFNHCYNPARICLRRSQVSLLRVDRRCSVSDDSPASAHTSPVAPPFPEVLESSPQAGDEDGNGETVEERRRGRRGADSTDWISSSLTRRFGLAGGLAWVGFLAFGVVSEQIKTRTEVFLKSQGTQDVVEAKEVVLDNNVKYVDLRTGGGSSPLRGDLVLVDITGKVRNTGEIFINTSSGYKRPLAFIYGLKPYARGVCYGLEYAIQSMKAGGKRKVTVPADQCFGDAGADLGGGVVVPGGAEIEYEVLLQRVSVAPS